MMTLPAALAAKIKSNDLRGIKPIILMYRNKWDAQNNTFAPETTPIDITEQVIKCGTLSTKLDVGEINEYTASNVTLTISDPHNHFVEGTPKSYFPDDYQIYGTRIELYAGTDTNNMTPLFYGVIRSLPNHKPEEYQLDISVVSALELLDDVEAKDFSTPYTSEKLTLDHQDDDAGPVYRTANTGVGGFNAVYANGSVLAEGVDYEVSQLGEYVKPALVEIINEEFYSATITADYYCWKRNLKIEDIVTGLLQKAGYSATQMQISPVVFNTSVRSEIIPNVMMSLGYKKQNAQYVFNSGWDAFWGISHDSFYNPITARFNIFPEKFNIKFRFGTRSGSSNPSMSYAIGELNQNLSHNYYNLANSVKNGIVIYHDADRIHVYWRQNNITVSTNTAAGSKYAGENIEIQKTSNGFEVKINSITYSNNIIMELNEGENNEAVVLDWRGNLSDYVISDGEGNQFNLPGIMTAPISHENEAVTWSYFFATLDSSYQYRLEYRTKNSGDAWTEWKNIDLGETPSVNSVFIQYKLTFLSSTPQFGTDISNLQCYFLSSALYLNIVNLSNQTILEVIQDLALITGYEFGIDRNNVFFFRPRQTSTQPIATLDKFELVKIDTVTRNFNELATKLTLTFAAAPLEFYANTGARPTPVDKYGVIDKEIDKPQLINYDNPELAQAIGPQLLAIYSELPNIITCTGKLNLALELGDIVNLKREMPLTINPAASDYTKYEGLNTFYRACKITGLNYDFTKRQIKYTLRDVSNDNNAPVKDYYEYQTIFPTPLDYKE